LRNCAATTPCLSTGKQEQAKEVALTQILGSSPGLQDKSWSDKLSLYEDWYNTEMPGLFGYLFYQTQDRQLAQDITADTCLHALERLEQYDPSRGKLKNWMFGIARNQLRDHMRTQRHRPPHIMLADVGDDLTTDDGLELDYDQQEAFLEVISHLDTLNEREREIMALRYGAGLSNAEIASMLQLSSNHVAVVISRAIGRLKEKVESRVHDVF
jgi:RNA polymerase sigma-70 factor (ECF subfamily)